MPELAAAGSFTLSRDVAHRYALALDIDTLVLGVKNRAELAACLAAAEAGPLPPERMARVDATVDRSGDA